MAPLATFGQQQVGATEPQDFGIYGFRGGLNLKGTPQEIGDTDLTTAINGYLRADGAFSSRFGMTRQYTLTAGTPVIGLARFFQQVVNGATVSVVHTLCQQGNNLVNADTNTVIGTIAATGGTAQPWSAVRITDPNPQFFSGPTDVLVICTGSGGPYIYDGTNLYTPTGWAPAAGARWCAAVNGIVWFGMLPSQPNALLGTGYGQTPSDSFESCGGYRAFTFSQPLTGLSALGDGATAALVIGLNQGVGSLTGTTPNTFFLQETPSTDGCVAGNTMVQYGGVVFFLGKQAVYLYDGVNPPQRLSDKVEPWILGADSVASLIDLPMGPSRTNAFAFVHDNRLYIVYSIVGSSLMQAVLVFDFIVQGWTALLLGVPLTCAANLDAPQDNAPIQALVGSGVTGRIYLWNQLNASGTADDDGTAFTTIVQTKYFKLGEPGTNKKLYRFYPELFINGSFNGYAGVTTDYGANASQALSSVVVPAPTIGTWGSGLWGTMFWSGGGKYTYFGSPYSRVDVGALEADAFSFQMATYAASVPWILAGVTGVFLQCAKT